MTWLPISGTPPQFTTSGEQAEGYVLKFYEVGTTTPLAVSTNSTGTPTTTDFVLDTQGYTTLSAAKVIPYVSTPYKVIMYLNQTDADANDTGSAVFTIDNIRLTNLFDTNIIVNNVTALAAVDTTAFTTAYAKGTTTVNDGGQGWFFFNSSSVLPDNGTTIIQPDVGTGRWLVLVIGNGLVTPPSLSFTPTIKTIITVSDPTWTPNANTSAIVIEAIGAGGGGGGCAATAALQFSCSSGGGGGGYVLLNTTTIDASYAIVIGAGGAGGAIGNNNGTVGGNTTVTSDTYTLIASGGGGGLGGASTAGNVLTSGVNGGTASGGSINSRGCASTYGAAGYAGGASGASFFGGSVIGSSAATGTTPTTYGAGGGAAGQPTSSSAGFAGGAGAAGVVIITEYLGG